jgi:sporulation integral membrane protein YlbJ
MLSREASEVISRSKTLALGSMAAFLVIIIILFPDAAFQSSLQGLTIWWQLVFPALLPFLILTELLIGFGVIQAVGTLLGPLMRLLFRLPGTGGWALASGLIVGFPIGAKITASLREKELLTRQEAQRLVNISHLCSPLFMITVVGVGFLHQSRLGLLLAVVHYAAAIVTGLIISARKQNDLAEINGDPPTGSSKINASKQTALPVDWSSIREMSLWKQSQRTLHEAYLHDGRAFGKLLGDAVTDSVQALMLIGGYMMIYSVLLNVLNMTQLTAALQQLTAGVLAVLDLGPDLISQLLSGTFEIHLGAFALAQTQDVPQLWQIALLSALLSWGGLSAHAQVAGFIHKTDIRYLPFLLTRSLQAIIAFLLVFILWKPLQLIVNHVEPSLLQLEFVGSTQGASPKLLGSDLHAWHYWPLMFIAWLLVLGVMLLLSLVVWRSQKRT